VIRDCNASAGVISCHHRSTHLSGVTLQKRRRETFISNRTLTRCDIGRRASSFQRRRRRRSGAQGGSPSANTSLPQGPTPGTTFVYPPESIIGGFAQSARFLSCDPLIRILMERRSFRPPSSKSEILARKGQLGDQITPAEKRAEAQP